MERRSVMIFHTIRFTLKPNAPKDQVEVAFEQLRKCGREIKAVQYFCVGRDFGREFEYGALYAIQDIGGYRQYPS
jgi:Stress responsive A/B Barrel Domain